MPDGASSGISEAEALARTTHLSIATHQDDLEILAFHGIKECYRRSDRWFTGVVVSDGAGSPRSGAYANYTDAQMKATRREEQRKAAVLGEYSIQYQLDYSSAQIKSRASAGDIANDLFEILQAAKPETVYLHNPADRHDTHVAVFLRSLEALRKLPRGQRPARVFGCEVWRDLDWLTDADKIALPVSEHQELALRLCAVFDSQIAGGKRYDLATLARRQAHATFSSSHETDRETGLTLAVDLRPLVDDDRLSPVEFTMGLIERLRDDVRARLETY